MSATRPASKTEIKNYALRRLGYPTIDINVATEQLDDLVEEAIDYMQELKEFQPLWIEEPTARDDIQGHIKISVALKKLGIGVASGEQVPSPVIFKQLLQAGALGYCQID